MVNENQLTIRSLDREPVKVEIWDGLSLYQVMDIGNVPEDIRENIVIFNHGSIVADWSYITKPGDNLTICVVPTGGGGGGLLNAVATVAVVIAAVVAAPVVAGAIGVTAAAGVMAVGAGLAMLGTLAVNALIPPPAVNIGSFGGYATIESPTVAAATAQTAKRAALTDQGEVGTYSVTGQSNQQGRYGVIPVIYGKHQFFPKIASTPHIENFGKTSIITALYDFGPGEVELDTLHIGDTPASVFGAEFITHTYTKTPDLKYVHKRVSYEQFSYVLNDPKSITIRTKPGSNGAMIDIQFPGGLCSFNKYTGDREGHSVSFSITWKNIDGSTSGGVTKWAGNTSNGNVSASTAQSFVTNAYMEFPTTGQYDITVTRTSGGTLDDRIRDDATLAALKSYAPGKLINLDEPHTMVEMKIEASEKISGVVQNLNCIAYRKLRWHDGTSWQPPKRTSNPAWIVCDILTGQSNIKPLNDDQIDMVSFCELAAICDEEVETEVNGFHIKGPRFETNLIVDESSTLQQLCNSILANCRAQLIITQNGKWGVLIDKEQPIVRQLFTPDNSWGFTGNRYFTEYPHALRVTFVNPDLNWQKDECLVYNDDYTVDTAREFEQLDTLGVTSYAQAWRQGRYFMAQALWRSEIFSLTTDIENLAVQRGERVQVAHDVPGVGGVSCRVLEVWGDKRIRVSEKVSANFNSYTIRYADGTIKNGIIEFVVDADAFDIDTTAGIQGDELIILGNTERVVGDYVVYEIEPGSDLTADITLIPYAPKIFNVDNDKIPIWYPQWGDGVNFTDLEVLGLTATQKIYYPQRYPMLHIDLNWKETSAPELVLRYNIYIKRPGQPDEFLAYAYGTHYTHVIDVLGDKEHMVPCTYEVIPVSKTGVLGKIGDVDVVPIHDNTKPVMPENFNVNIQRETAQLFWTKTKEPDVIEYEIRYTPDTLRPLWNASQFLASISWTSTTFSVGARTGTYMIRAIDSSGNKSDVAMQRTTVVDLENVENIEIIDDSMTGWGGQAYGVDYVGEELWSGGNWGEVNPESSYYFEDIVDLTDIYEVRVASKLKARGESWYDLMINWVPSLLDVPFMARASAEQWDAWLEYRSVDVIKYMAEWKDLTVAEVPDLVGGGSPWSEWRSILVGDVTAKIIQFRIQMRSYDNLVKAVLMHTNTEIDAMDRIWYLDDVKVPVGGLDVNFDPAFMFDSVAIAVTIDGNDQPVVAYIDNKTRLGFKVELVNTQTFDSVAGRVDIMARGQGKERHEIL